LQLGERKQNYRRQTLKAVACKKETMMQDNIQTGFKKIGFNDAD
jgi:hypothetical protein